MAPRVRPKTEVGERADDAHALLHLRGGGEFVGLGSGVAHEAAGGEQQDTAEFEAVPCCAKGTRDLSYGDGEQQEEPEGEAAGAGSAGHGGVADRQAEEQQKEGMDANIHPENSSDRKRPPAHSPIVCAASMWAGRAGRCLPYLDACHCRNLSLPSARCPARDADSSDERPAA